MRRSCQSRQPMEEGGWGQTCKQVIQIWTVSARRDISTEKWEQRKVSSFSPGAQGRLLGEILKDKSGVAEQRSRWESVGTCRGLLGVKHGWSKNPVERT